MKNILLIPGHGGKDSGAVAADLREADLALEVALEVANLLREKYCIYMSRDRATQYLSPSGQLAMINDICEKVGLEAAIAIHFNASVDPQAHGIETLYRDDNDFWLAQIIHRNILTDTDLKDRGCKEDVRNLAVFKALPEVPVCLCELGFITNPHDHEFIEGLLDKNPETISVFADSIARALQEALA